MGLSPRVGVASGADGARTGAVAAQRQCVIGRFQCLVEASRLGIGRREHVEFPRLPAPGHPDISFGESDREFAVAKGGVGMRGEYPGRGPQKFRSLGLSLQRLEEMRKGFGSRPRMPKREAELPLQARTAGWTRRSQRHPSEMRGVRGSLQRRGGVHAV